MVEPHPIRPDPGRLGQKIAAYGEQVDADLQRFDANRRSTARRSGLCSVLAAVLVVSFGVWGFRYETNSSTLPVRHRAPAGRPAASTVMVILAPVAGQPGRARE